MPLQPDTICYYTDEIIENVQVWNLEDDQIESVYRPQITEKEGQVDLYDFYLGGASPVQVLTSPQAQTDRKLIIFEILLEVVLHPCSQRYTMRLY